jgi:uncharacterized protein YigE (DUF2233 family)
LTDCLVAVDGSPLLNVPKPFRQHTDHLTLLPWTLLFGPLSRRKRSIFEFWCTILAAVSVVGKVSILVEFEPAAPPAAQAATGLAAHTNGALAGSGPCQPMEYERVGYAICEVDLRRHAVRLYWTRSDGTPYAYLSALPRDLEGGAGRLLFATNAGMFDSKLKPVGRYVEEGQELVHANTKSGRGNFHMKPNGIFYISGGNAAVAETHAFLKQQPAADLATQSGPLLVMNGRLHPRFNRGSVSLKLRSGVGVRTDGKVIFAISQEAVSFDSFARLFRDGQKCPNALFLDGGSASNLYAPTLNRSGNILPLGPMLAVFDTNKAAPGQ